MFDNYRYSQLATDDIIFETSLANKDILTNFRVLYFNFCENLRFPSCESPSPQTRVLNPLPN